jgi:hypothetical protein
VTSNAQALDPPQEKESRGVHEMQGFPSRNLPFICSFADEFRDAAIVKQLASQLPRWHLIRLMQRVKEPERSRLPRANRSHLSFRQGPRSWLPLRDRQKCFWIPRRD